MQAVIEPFCKNLGTNFDISLNTYLVKAWCGVSDFSVAKSQVPGFP